MKRTCKDINIKFTLTLNFKGVRTLKEQETNNAQPFFFFTTTKRDFKGKRGQEDNKVFLTFFT